MTVQQHRNGLLYVFIPSKIANKLDLHKGASVVVIEDEDSIRIVKAEKLLEKMTA